MMIDAVLSHLSTISPEGLIVGSFLMLWFFYDLFNGSVYLHRAFERQYEPVAYCQS